MGERVIITLKNHARANFYTECQNCPFFQGNRSLPENGRCTGNGIVRGVSSSDVRTSAGCANRIKSVVTNKTKF